MHGTTTPLVRTVAAKHGEFDVYTDDELVGLSLSTYGEYSEGEVLAFKLILRPGDVALDVGANIGAFTVPLAKIVGPTGKVFAFEASRANVELLHHNCHRNVEGGIVKIIPQAASDRVGHIRVSRQDALHAYCRPEINAGDFEVECITIDSLDLPRVNMIKIDVDRHELQVLKGAEQTIKRCRPVIYMENESDDLREELVAWLIDHGYRLYWHRPYHFNIDNFFGVKRNIFGALVSIMNVCVPDDQRWSVKSLEEVSDYRSDDEMFTREAARYLRYVDRDPDDLQSRWMAAHHFNLMQMRTRANELIDENLALDPEHVPTRALLAYMTLQDGHYNRESWKGYEIRHKQPNRHQFGGDRTFPEGVERWDGELTDKPLLIWTEQGFGDNIMFIRFFEEVLKRAPNAFLECRPELYELFKYSPVVPSATQYDSNCLYRLGRTLPPYELQLPLPSVAWAIGADNEMIRRKPYLSVDPGLVANCKGKGHVRLGQTPEGLLNGARIGLCHQGSGSSERTYSRDVPREELATLVRDYGPMFPLQQQGQFDSFFMTAAAIEALDLVITVDTSVAHLAGALGKETWLLLSWDPDFRWGLKEPHTIWYDSIRIFRQPRFRDWTTVIDEVRAELAKR